MFLMISISMADSYTPDAPVNQTRLAVFLERAPTDGVFCFQLDSKPRSFIKDKWTTPQQAAGIIPKQIKIMVSGGNKY